jgi:hypothetical protein
MILKIIIPTRNRPNKLKKQLERLDTLAGLLQKNGIELKIFIGDNSDSKFKYDKTTEFASEITCKNPPNILLTAEENLFFCIQNSGTGWTWILGDDDPFSVLSAYEAFIDIFETGKSEEFDAVFFNSIKFSIGISSTSTTQAIFTSKSNQITDMNHLFQNFGIIGTTAGFSNWLMNIKKEDTELYATQLVAPCKIYAHVFFLISKLRDASILVRSNPLVWYKLNDHDQDNSSHWNSYAQKANITQYYSWHLNILENIYELESKSILKPFFIHSMIEFDSKNHPFGLVDFLLGKFLKDLELGGDKKLSKDDVDRFLYLSRSMEIMPEFILELLETYSYEVTLRGKRKSKQLKRNLENSIKELKTMSSDLLWNSFLYESGDGFHFRSTRELIVPHFSMTQLSTVKPLLLNNGERNIHAIMDRTPREDNKNFNPTLLAQFQPNRVEIFFQAASKKLPKFVKSILKKYLGI